MYVPVITKPTSKLTKKHIVNEHRVGKLIIIFAKNVPFYP